MSFGIIRSIQNFLSLSVSKHCEAEFISDIDRINLTRGKLTACTFIILEILQLAISVMIKKGSFFKAPGIYYGIMYALMIFVMFLFLMIFCRLEKNIIGYRTAIRVVGILFAGFILLWCAGISLLDQMTYGMTMVYIVAVICVGVAPIYKPSILLLIYLPVHIVFLALMPFFQKSSGSLFSNYINCTAFVIMAWAISFMRYQKQVEEFNNSKLIQEKSNELNRVNKELEEANRKLEKLSQIDGLTGIFNRSMFDRVMKAEWERCKCHLIPLSLIMVDIDLFKAFNDNYGHQAGDECIQKIAEALLACANRSSNTVARYGGEEFAIILPHTEKEAVSQLAQQIRKKVEELAILHEHSFVADHVTISMGTYTTIPSDAISIAGFIKSADEALYKAKIRRNDIVVT